MLQAQDSNCAAPGLKMEFVRGFQKWLAVQTEKEREQANKETKKKEVTLTPNPGVQFFILGATDILEDVKHFFDRLYLQCLAYGTILYSQKSIGKRQNIKNITQF